MQPSWWVCHDRKLKNPLPAMCWWFDSVSTESGLQRTLNRFVAAYDTPGMKISTVKTDGLYASRNSNQYLLQLNGPTQKQLYKFKYLGVAFTRDRRHDEWTGYPNWQGNCNNESFAQFSWRETRIVEKKQSSQFLKQPLSLLTSCVSVWSWKFDSDWKGAIASANIQNVVSSKNQRSYILDKVRISWDSKISKGATSLNWKISA